MTAPCGPITAYKPHNMRTVTTSLTSGTLHLRYTPREVQAWELLAARGVCLCTYAECERGKA